MDLITCKLFKYLSSISEVIDFDMYIVNNKLLRIVGTGMYEKMLGIRLPDNTSNGWVIKNQEKLVMFEPLHHKICQGCPMQKSDNCGMEYSIHAPIMINDKCLGVVTIASRYDEESKERIVRDKEKLLKFVEYVSEGIADMMRFEYNNELHKSIFLSTEEAMIITDEEGNISDMSKVIETKFKSFKNIYEIIGKNNETYGSVFRNEEFKINDNLMAKRVKVNLNESEYNQIFFIRKIDKTLKGTMNSDERLIDEELFLGQIIGKSKSIEELKKKILHMAKYSSNCLILGESGTGKEMFARLIHKISERGDGPFVPINCAAIPYNLLESEMFGYESGSFTGASKHGKKGLFEIANGGTVFLDEIGDMPVYLQPKLLRVLETGKITRVGGTEEIQLNVRFIAATNKQISNQIKSGEFREDLYYRLCVIPLNLPPLRERTDDIIELTNHFIEKYNSKFNKSISGISSDVKKQLLIYDWPGNVRELENVIEYAITMEKSAILSPESLPASIDYEKDILSARSSRKISDFKKENIKDLIEKRGDTVDSKTEIAKELGISLSTLYRYIKKYQI